MSINRSLDWYKISFGLGAVFLYEKPAKPFTIHARYGYIVWVPISKSILSLAVKDESSVPKVNCCLDSKKKNRTLVFWTLVSTSVWRELFVPEVFKIFKKIEIALLLRACSSRASDFCLLPAIFYGLQLPRHFILQVKNSENYF